MLSPQDRILRTRDAMQMLGMKPTTFYEKLKRGELPGAVRLGPRAVGWYESELLIYIRSLPRAA